MALLMLYYRVKASKWLNMKDLLVSNINPETYLEERFRDKS